MQPGLMKRDQGRVIPFGYYSDNKKLAQSRIDEKKLIKMPKAKVIFLNVSILLCFALCKLTRTYDVVFIFTH